MPIYTHTHFFFLTATGHMNVPSFIFLISIKHTYPSPQKPCKQEGSGVNFKIFERKKPLKLGIQDITKVSFESEGAMLRKEGKWNHIKCTTKNY